MNTPDQEYRAALKALNEAAYRALRACPSRELANARKKDLLAMALETDKMVDETAPTIQMERMHP
ncbi:hypothetical protein [Pseudohoeflea coraliihabitans]|uniref:Uncharacterized protein n=1 Tax=Pseudohoeflea coraliihabitans TaxID=2860393 RepID=A0ABS6WLL4_9HYPH|nr:hypothetical protein [Pseudohoeflea sp. DP4N28-3]MBW3096851.1 hypothetical protein [Pseudohoeflea sp. DP4N28-3]